MRDLLDKAVQIIILVIVCALLMGFAAAVFSHGGINPGAKCSELCQAGDDR